MRRPAFTLIELLVIISIVAILMGILLPALRAVRLKSRVVICSSNLKHLSLALNIYEKENETFPYGFDDSKVFGGPRPPGGYPGIGSHDYKGWWWFHFLSGTIGKDFSKGSLLWCPLRNVLDPLSKPNILCGNYGVNQAICKNTRSLGADFIGSPLGLSQIKNPSLTLLAVDSGYALVSWKAASNMSGPLFGNKKREGSFYIPGMEINKKREITPGAEVDAIDGRHPNKTVNVAFSDFHIESVESDDLFVEQTDNGYNNLTPLWLPK